MTCLAKDPDDRWQNCGDIARELKWVAEGPAAGVAALRVGAGARKRPELLAWAVAAVAVLFGVLSPLLFRRQQAPVELTRFTVPPPSGQSFLPLIALSPDARRIAFLLLDDGRKNLGRRALAGQPRAAAAVRDRRRARLFLVARRPGDRLLPGGKTEANRRGRRSRPDDLRERRRVFRRLESRGHDPVHEEFGAPLLAVPATGGTPRPITAPDPARGEAHFHPAFLPDGRHFVFVARDIDPEKTSVMLASLDSKEIRRLFHADSAAVYADPGYLLFARDNALFAWRLDPRGLKLVGEPIPTLERPRYPTEDNLLSVSATGNRVAYLPWLLRRRLVWVDRKGRELGTLGETGGYEDVRISPDGGKVAVSLRDPSHGQNLDVWVLDSRGTGSRITAERTDEFDPAWFPDGDRLVYVSDHVGFYNLYERPANGGAEKLLVRTKHDKLLPTVTPDGRQLLASVPEGSIFTRVLFPLSGQGDSVRLSGDSRFSEEHPEISPDARWTAFDSTDSGQREVYVQPLAPAGGPKQRVSVGGGQMPAWNRNGSELFYAARDGMLMSVALRPSGGRLEIAEPQPLFLLQLGMGGEPQFHRHPYDVSSDGQRFLVIRRAPDADAEGAVVVTNWTAALKGSR